MSENIPDVLSGEFEMKNVQNLKIETETPKIIAAGSGEIEIPKLKETEEVVDVDSLRNDLADLDDKIKPLYAKIRSYQNMAKQHAGNPEIVAKLNEESRQFVVLFDELQAKRDALVAKIKQNSKD